MVTTKKIERELQDNVRNRVKNVEKIKEVEKFVNDNLLDVFSSNDFFVDGITDRKLNDTLDSIRDVVKQADDKIERLLTEFAATGDAARKAAIKAEIKDIEDTITGKVTQIDMAGNISRDPLKPYGGVYESSDFIHKREDYEGLDTCADHFDLSTDKLSGICKRGDSGAGLTMALDGSFLKGGAPSPDRYYIVGDDGKEIKSYGGKYKIKMSMADGTEKDVEITGLSIDPVTHQLKISKDVAFAPEDIDTTKPLVFNVACAYTDVEATAGIHTGINVVHAKKIEVTLDFERLGRADREALFDNYNIAVDPHPIEKALEETFTDDFATHKYNHHIERQVLEKVLKKFNAAKYDSLNEAQKEKFFQRMLRGGRQDGTDNPKLEDYYISGNIRLYDTYKNWFVDDDKKWNKDKNNTMSKLRYIDFIKDQASSQDKCKEFISDALEKEMSDIANFNKICSRFTEFLDEVEHNKTDNDMNEQMDKKFFIKRERALKMNRGPRSPFRPRDVNYMRFFNGSSKSMKDQTVNIYTREGHREKSEVQPFKYDLDMYIAGKNNINLMITIDGQKEPISIKSGQPWTLARRVLRDNRIPYGKARAHICFNIYRSMVEMAKDRHMSLSYNEGGYLREIDFVDGNLIMKEWREIGYKSDKPSEKFTQKIFLGVNDFERDNDPGDIGVLRRGIEGLGLHFNKAMNTLHTKYRKGIERRFLGAVNSRNRFRLPVSAWTSPIKKLLNCKTVSNFDFHTTVNSNGKSINISFKKNKFFIDMHGLKKQISSRDLGKLLNHRQGKIRVFDGMERDIVEGVYVALISKLRENSKISRTNFGFVDDITGRLYVLDKDGDFGYIPKKDREGVFGHPMRGVIGGLIPKIKKFGALKDKKLSTIKGYTKLDPEVDADQIHEIMKNPFLMQRLVRAMNRRMGLLESMRSIFIT